jgi:hypothetical protein
MPNGSSDDITESTVKRTKLEASLVTETDDYFTDTLDWIGSSYTLEKGMKSFYDKTGVQPYLYICDNIGTNGDFSEEAQQEFGDELYSKLFNDEGHLLLVFCEYSSGDYVSFVTVGTSAKTVIDSEAREILLDYVDHYYYSDYEDDEFFSLAFEKAGSRIMSVNRSYTWVAVVVIVLVVGVIFLLKWLEKRNEQKSERLKKAQDILNKPLNGYDDSAENLAGKYEDN